MQGVLPLRAHVRELPSMAQKVQYTWPCSESQSGTAGRCGNGQDGEMANKHLPASRLLNDVRSGCWAVHGRPRLGWRLRHSCGRLTQQE